ncbi:MAG: hypothetical protein LUD47_07655 [Clostridia bacterium]|nr:hypothetical protein [Clostridia bacterium]
MEWKTLYGKVKAIDKKVVESMGYTNDLLMYGDKMKKEGRMTYGEASKWAEERLGGYRKICNKHLKEPGIGEDETKGWRKVLKACDEVPINMPIM